MQKTEPSEADAKSFRVHYGDLDAALEYFVLEYPTPPPVDLSVPEQLAANTTAILAPYFSAVVRNRNTKLISYYALGQAPFGGGTTFRCVTRDGKNCNLGPGPEPRLDLFLARLPRS